MDSDRKRVYQNNDTGSECITELLYTDLMGNKWWGFTDLFTMPYIRKAYTENLSMLFGVGLSKKDIETWIKKEKELLKSNDAEKYEKLYALVLEKENIIASVTDPLRQHLGLCSIYVLSDDERVDFYSPIAAEKKLQTWAMDLAAQSFFLNWVLRLMELYSKHSKEILKIASTLTESADLIERRAQSSK